MMYTHNQIMFRVHKMEKNLKNHFVNNVTTRICMHAFFAHVLPDADTKLSGVNFIIFQNMSAVTEINITAAAAAATVADDKRVKSSKRAKNSVSLSKLTCLF